MWLYDRLKQWCVGATIRLVVDDIYKHPERYYIMSLQGIYVYRNGKVYMYIYPNGEIALLSRQYNGVTAKIIRRALAWALRNGCTVK